MRQPLEFTATIRSASGPPSSRDAPLPSRYPATVEEARCTASVTDQTLVERGGLCGRIEALRLWVELLTRESW